MGVGPRGSILFQELSEPYKSNPNVEIMPMIDQCAVHFIGIKEAVWSAYKHFTDGLNRELHIQDRSAADSIHCIGYS